MKYIAAVVLLFSFVACQSRAPMWPDFKLNAIPPDYKIVYNKISGKYAVKYQCFVLLTVSYYHTIPPQVHYADAGEEVQLKDSLEAVQIIKWHLQAIEEDRKHPQDYRIEAGSAYDSVITPQQYKL